MASGAIYGVSSDGSHFGAVGARSTRERTRAGRAANVHRFHNPELDRVVENALANNQSLKKATEVLREAEAFSQVEGARLLPFLSADAGMRQSRIPPMASSPLIIPPWPSGKTMAYVNPLSLHYEFDFWGKNRAILNAALGEAAAQAAETEEVRLLLTTAVARAYFRIRALARQAETPAA